MKLIDYFVTQKIKQLVKMNNSRQHCFRSLKEAHNILIFYEAKDEEEIEPCLETLRMLKKDLFVCKYVANKVLRKDKNAYFHVYRGRDFNLLGFPKRRIQEQINKQKADILIDLTGKGCSPMKFLMLQHTSRFKIGLKRSREEQDLYDFTLSVTNRDDMMYLFGQIIFYLQTIRTK